MLYISPIGDIIRGHGHADDSQLYITFSASLLSELEAKSKVEVCVKEINSWMVKNKLKMNGD